MARMYPSKPDPDTPRSERKVFEAFENYLPDEFTVVHARRLILPATDRHGRFEGESDFLVLHPRRGLLALEVKGGTIGRDREGWYTIPRGSQQRKSIKDPGKQAQTIVHRLNDYLKERKPFSMGLRTPPFGHGVVFPSSPVDKGLDPALPREIVLDECDLAQPRTAVLGIYDAHGMADRDLPDGQVDAVVHAIAPVVQLAASLASRIGDEAKQLVQLTQEQVTVLGGLEEQRRVGIKGVAGSGKTLLAMEKAERMAREGKRVLFLCYNEPLADHLAQHAENFTVKTFHKLCADMAKAAGLPFKAPADADGAREFFEEEAPQKLIDALGLYPDERFDAVVIDEGQDFREYWWPAIEELLRSPYESVFYVFWDPNQDLYGGGPNEALGLSPFSLTYNCRNTERIAAHACAYLDMTAKVRPGTPKGEMVEEHSAKGDREMVARVRKMLHRFMGEGKVESHQLVVLTAGAVENSPVWKARRLGNVELVELGTKPGPNQVRFSSIHRFKGLEADVIVVCDVDPAKKSSGPYELHVGTSRARHVLAVVRRQ